MPLIIEDPRALFGPLTAASSRRKQLFACFKRFQEDAREYFAIGRLAGLGVSVLVESESVCEITSSGKLMRFCFTTGGPGSSIGRVTVLLMPEHADLQDPVELGSFEISPDGGMDVKLDNLMGSVYVHESTISVVEYFAIKALETTGQFK